MAQKRKAPFLIGMEEWLDEDGEDVGERKKRLPLSLKKKRPNQVLPCTEAKKWRFSELASDSDVQKASEGIVAKNTEKNDRWALNAFRAWKSERNDRCESKCPDVLERDDAELLNKWLSLFVLEVRKSDGTQYPPQSILCGLQRYMRRNNAHPVSIFDKSDVLFRGLRGTMESLY